MKRVKDNEATEIQKIRQEKKRKKEKIPLSFDRQALPFQLFFCSADGEQENNRPRNLLPAAPPRDPLREVEATSDLVHDTTPHCARDGPRSTHQYQRYGCRGLVRRLWVG